MTDIPVQVQPQWSPGMPLHSTARTVAVTIDDHGYHLDWLVTDDLIARLVAAREQTWPPPGPMTRRECPLPDCAWYHDEADWLMSLALMPTPTVEQMEEARRLLGAEPDPIRDASLASMLIYTQRVERVLRDHFKTHPLENWVLEVVRLQAELEQARRAPEET